MQWSKRSGVSGFYSRQLPERWLSEDMSIADSFGEPTQLPNARQRIVAETHRLISSRWANGGLVSGLWRIEQDHGMADLPAPSPTAIACAVDTLASQKLLPSELAGCSAVFLDSGGVWPEALEQFGKAIYLAIQGGGAYSEQLRDVYAEEKTKQYLHALAGECEADGLRCFGLDPAFSSWFYGVHWDFAYAIVNRLERWLMLVCATDTD